MFCSEQFSVEVLLALLEDVGEISPNRNGIACVCVEGEVGKADMIPK